MRTVQGMITQFDLTACDDLSLENRRLLQIVMADGIAGGILMACEAVHQATMDGEFQMEVFEPLIRARLSELLARMPPVS